MATRAQTESAQPTPRKRSAAGKAATDAPSRQAGAAARSTDEAPIPQSRASDGRRQRKSASTQPAAAGAGSNGGSDARQTEPAAETASQPATSASASSAASSASGAGGPAQSPLNALGAMFSMPGMAAGFAGMPSASALPGFGSMPGFGGMPGFGALPAMMGLTGLPGIGPFASMAGRSGMSGFPTIPGMPGGIGFDTGKLATLQQEYATRLQDIMMRASDPKSIPIKDKRFSDPSWHEGTNALSAAMYLLNSEMLIKMADAVQGDEKTRERVRFATEQWVEAMSPANFLATNPEVQQLLLKTQGKSLTAGIENLVGDIVRGRISQVDETAFEVGRNVATSPGNVVWQNELIQLIQYSPSTPTVGRVPLLMVPPCINKFYILDLQPDNSYVAHAVGKGHTVFMVSWRNVGPEQGHLTWDDYLRDGIVAAIDVVRDIAGVDKINMLGFCVGGTIVCSALAALAARGARPVQSLTLLTTLLDFADTGVLGIFIDENSVRLREQQMGNGGLLSGRDLGTTFSFLRPNDLVWNYFVNNYLKGERPAAFDLLYWNADSTNLPGPMYCWYLRNMYLENKLKQPGALTCLGQPVDLRKIDVPTYAFGAREDHIVPWRAAFASARALGDHVRFVLGASGHIAGTINSAKKNKRSYWAAEDSDPDPDRWLANAKEQPGSWWTDWDGWLDQFKGQEIPAEQAQSDRYPPLEPAPGSYVKQRA